MKQVYFSEKLNKYFDSKKECEAAEAAFDQEKIKKEKAKEARSEDAKKVEEAYKHIFAVRKEASQMIREANRMIEDAQQAYYKARREFVNKYGSFHMTYSNDNGDETISTGDLFDAFQKVFEIDLTK